MENLITLSTIILLSLAILICLYQYKKQFLFVKNVYKYSIKTKPNNSVHVINTDTFIDNIVIHSYSYDSNEILMSVNINDDIKQIKLYNNEAYNLNIKNTQILQDKKISITTDVNTKTIITISTISL